MMRSILSIAIIILLGSVVIAAPLNVYAVNHCTQLWVYTEPVQKGPCIVFKHQSSAEIAAANNANIEFNKGVFAGQKAPENMKCPNSNKDFCQGFASTRVMK